MSVTKIFFIFFFPTPELPVSGSKGLISAVVTVTTAPLCYNEYNIHTLFNKVKRGIAGGGGGFVKKTQTSHKKQRAAPPRDQSRALLL